MNQRTLLIGAGILLIALLASSVVAVYYRQRATVLNKLHTAAEQELASMREEANIHPAPESGAGPEAPVVTPAETGENERLLRNRIQKLEAEVKAKETLLASLQNQSTNKPPDRRRGRWRDRGEAWLEEMKKNNPEGFEALRQRREGRKKALNNTLARKTNFFLERDRSELTGEEQEQYEYLLNLLDETSRATESSQNDALPWPERLDAYRTVFRNARELSPLLDTEREVELYNLGLSVGYTEKEAEEFTGYVEELIEVTTMNSMFESFLRGRGQPSFRSE